MRERKYLFKSSKWLTEKMYEDSWSSVFLTLIETSIGYAIIYFLPQIMFFLNGHVTDPARQKWRMTWIGVLCLIILFFTALKVIRLIRKKTFPKQQ